jgi:hypothetical protein
MSVRFSRLDRRAIRQLRPGNKISEHGITAERLGDNECAIRSPSWSTASASTAASD